MTADATHITFVDAILSEDNADATLVVRLRLEELGVIDAEHRSNGNG